MTVLPEIKLFLLLLIHRNCIYRFTGIYYCDMFVFLFHVNEKKKKVLDLFVIVKCKVIRKLQ